MPALQKRIGADAEPAPTKLHRAASLADEVYEAIFRQLMALKIAPGARISVDGLARELDVSQTPIREALSRLEAEGLVRKTHLVGYSAAPQITKRGLDEIYELRLKLEPDAARAAASRLEAESLAQLRSIADSMAVRHGSDERIRYSTFARQDAVFHDRILELAGNALIRGLLWHQHTHFHIFRLMFHARVTEEALDEHGLLMSAFEAGDGDAAAKAMRAHIKRSRDRIHAAFE
jgi:DNA-binding GntR family transcriptional regulator